MIGHITGPGVERLPISIFQLARAGSLFAPERQQDVRPEDLSAHDEVRFRYAGGSTLDPAGDYWIELEGSGSLRIWGSVREVDPGLLRLEVDRIEPVREAG
jgi:hypothetical protein